MERGNTSHIALGSTTMGGQQIIDTPLTLICMMSVSLAVVPIKTANTLWMNICKIEHHDVLNFGFYADECREMYPSEWT
jgi:hypothetical protein